VVIDVNQSREPEDQPRQSGGMVRDDQVRRERELDGEGQQHPKAMVREQSCTGAIVKSNPHRNVEEPISAANQRLAPSSDATIDSARQEKRIENNEKRPG
jgi:hypothetical protein